MPQHPEVVPVSCVAMAQAQVSKVLACDIPALACAFPDAWICFLGLHFCCGSSRRLNIEIVCEDSELESKSMSWGPQSVIQAI